MYTFIVCITEMEQTDIYRNLAKTATFGHAHLNNVQAKAQVNLRL